MAWDEYRDERKGRRSRLNAREREEREPWDEGPARPARRRRDEFIRAGYRYDDDYERRWDPSYRHGWAGSGREGDYERYARGEPGFERDTHGRGRYGRRDDLEHGWEPEFDEDRYRYGLGDEVDDMDDVPAYARGWQRGPHAGRGPQGYQRSNERIVEDVSELLTRHGMVDASGIRVSAQEGEVTLEGTVDSRRAKRMAEDAAERVTGVMDVHNRLRIDRPG